MFLTTDIKSIPECACVYLLTNTINGKIYVGKANNLRRRIYNHLYHSKNPKNTSNPVVNAINKNGIGNFSIKVLEICEIGILMERETHYIDLLDATNGNIGYNILRHGFDRTGILHSADTISRISATCKKVVVRGADHWTHKDPLRNISKAHKSNVGKPRPQSLKDAVSKRWLGKRRPNLFRPIKQLHPETGELIKVWPSLIDAVLGVGGKSASGITAQINRRKNTKGYYQNTAYGYKWEYVSAA